MTDALQFEGTVIAHHRGDVHEINVEMGSEIRRVFARRSGHLTRSYIRVLPGDRVVVEVSPYDLSRGRIVRRLDGARGVA